MYSIGSKGDGTKSTPCVFKRPIGSIGMPIEAQSWQRLGARSVGMEAVTKIFIPHPSFLFRLVV
jgi:hypothetical protein